MKLFGWFEKWINERGSAAIMEKRLALKDEENAKLKAQIGEMDAKIKTLEASQQKQQIETDDVLIHNAIEFRRGIKTSGKWMGFCPKCHLPAENCLWFKQPAVVCTARCGWHVFSQLKLDALIQQIENNSII
jgi:hypothetical protein